MASSTPREQLLNVAEVAQMLGTWKTSGERFPRRLIEERRIAFVKVGRHVRIPASAVAQFIAENTVQPIPVRRSTMNRNAA
ncbi:excisionase family DNA-binding protein [Kitasatospora sp. NPDC058218]|uniref:excisionase family DNA-binding protein n=1 Tax=Kitasatospora sp. NPDC058218 TaxID=3346385 RepID=UPI0036D7E2E3